jgi:hypothetical protein
MSWEREHHHINLDASEHVISLIERGVVSRTGEPSRHLIQIKLGGPEFEYFIGANSVKIHLGGAMKVQPDGTLQDQNGQAFDPQAFEKQMIDRLNQHHTAMRAYAKKHAAPEYKGPKGKK